MLNAPEVRRARASDRSHHLVALREQQFGEVGSILSGNSGDNGPFGHGKPWNFSMTTEVADRFRRERQDADAAYNGALTELDRTIAAISARPVERDDIQRVATALIVFLQQITPFVDTKDRELASGIEARID